MLYINTCTVVGGFAMLTHQRVIIAQVVTTSTIIHTSKVYGRVDASPITIIMLQI